MEEELSTVFDSLSSIFMLVASVLSGYLLGALPIADRVSRRYGVDIFSEGTGLAGASNVRRTVGNMPGAFVMISDIAKGAATILIAKTFGVYGVWLLLPAAAAIIGHWNSIFAGFRGGDGLAPLAGIAVGIFPTYGVISVGVAMLIALGAQRMHYSSLVNIVFGYVALLAIGFVMMEDRTLLLGMGGLAAIVLAHAVLGHMRRNHDEDWEGQAEGSAANPLDLDLS